MSNLPPEITIEIYSNLSTCSDITALNGTSRLLYQIWFENAATISGAVLSRSIECYESLLELLELEKHVLAIPRDTSETSAILKALQQAQEQAQDHVSESRKNSYRGTPSSPHPFREVLNRNANLIAKANMASYACKAYELAKFLSDSSKLKGRKDIIAAYYNVWTVTTLKRRQAQRERLHAASKQEFDAMTKMTVFLAMERSDAKKLALGIVQRKFGNNRWLYGYDVNWRKALITNGEASGYQEAANWVRATQAYWISRRWVVEETRI